MHLKKIIFYGFRNSLGVAIYTTGIAWFLSNGEKLFGNAKNFLIPMAMLMLFIISAAITGMLVFLQPVLWFLNNNKKQAFRLLFITLGWLGIETIVVFTILALQ